jgi:hypothetical protein
MNQSERDALREKHYNMGNTVGMNGHNDTCAGCYQIYPCDVIKVLDWAEKAYSEGWKNCNDQWGEL